MIRKTAYGRTQLFLPTTTDVIREVKCMGGITHHTSAADVYHVLPDARTESHGCCWHCAEEISDEKTVVPLPRVYDTAEGVYSTYGRTCSPSCAKAYILEHTTFDRGQHLNVLVKMLRDVYAYTEPIVETPPRPALKRFGGVFDTRQSNRRVRCRLVQPPFVSYCMVVEEHMKDNPEREEGTTIPTVDMEEEEDSLDEPRPPALFEEFLKQKAKPPTTTKRPRDDGSTSSSSKAASSSKGPMSRFVR